MKQQVIFYTPKRIHLDKTAERLSKSDRVWLYDPTKDLIQFDLKGCKKTKTPIAFVQISPRGDRVNLYFDHWLRKGEVEDILQLLDDLIVDESDSSVELHPEKAIYRRQDPIPEAIRNIIYGMNVPLRLDPCSVSHEIVISEISPPVSDDYTSSSANMHFCLRS